MAARPATFTGFDPYKLTGVRVTDRELGHGSYATVLELEYMGLKCAGKKIHEPLLRQGDASYIVVRGFEEECRLLSQVRHPNIVQFLGVYFQQGVQAPILVTEFLPTNLTSCIDSRPYGILPKEIIYSILHDVALGLCYLHSQTPSIIHQNLSSNNVLLTPNMKAKISDLGVARILSLHMTPPPGIPAFMPPEAMVANPKYDTSIDVFSYGIMMIHMFSGQWPEPQVGASRISEGGKLIPVIEAERRENYFEAIEDNHPLMDLIHRCINNDPQLRPHAGEIIRRISRVASQFPASFANRLDMLRRIEILEEQIKPEYTCNPWKPSIAYSSDSFFITNEASAIEWKGHGLKIHIPDNSLAPSTSLDLSIRAHLEVHAHTLANVGKWYRDSDYLGHIPLSSLYSIQMGAGKLCRPVTIEFQHCLDVSDAVHNSDLVILRAADVTEHFEPIDDAVFDRSGYGKVIIPKNGSQEYDNFSWFIVALRRIFLPNTIRYKAYVCISKRSMKMYFIVTMALESCTTIVESQFPEKSYGLRTTFPVEFDERRRLSLGIPEDDTKLNGWVITPLYNPSITKQQVDRFCIFHNDLPKCEFSIQQTRGTIQSPPERLFQIDLTEGTANGKKYFVIDLYPLQNPAPPQDSTPTMPELLNFKAGDRNINISREIGSKYQNFGAQLLQEHTSAHIDDLEHRYRGNSEDINRHILQEWLEGRGRKPTTWATLARVLHDIEKGELAAKLEDFSSN